MGSGLLVTPLPVGVPRHPVRHRNIQSPERGSPVNTKVIILLAADAGALCATILATAASVKLRHAAKTAAVRAEKAERAASLEAERALTLSSRLTAMEEASESLALSLQEARREAATARLPRRRPTWPTNGGMA